MFCNQSSIWRGEVHEFLRGIGIDIIFSTIATEVVDGVLNRIYFRNGTLNPC